MHYYYPIHKAGKAKVGLIGLLTIGIKTDISAEEIEIINLGK